VAEVEDELFRFANAYTESDELRLALTDPKLALPARCGVQDLLGAQGAATSPALVSPSWRGPGR
jgi:hypothetical protein